MEVITTIADAILQKKRDINECQSKFISHIFLLFLSMRHRTAYMMMSRYGIYREQTYRNQFDKSFEFGSVKNVLIKKVPL
jgi:hypothetical protein